MPARLADTGFSKIIISSKLRQCVAMAHESLASSNLIGYLRVRILPNYVIGFISFFVVVFRMVIMKIWGESKIFFCTQISCALMVTFRVLFFLLECQFFTSSFSQEDAGDLIADIFGDSDEEEEAFEVCNTRKNILDILFLFNV